MATTYRTTGPPKPKRYKIRTSPDRWERIAEKLAYSIADPRALPIAHDILAHLPHAKVKMGRAALSYPKKERIWINLARKLVNEDLRQERKAQRLVKRNAWKNSNQPTSINQPMEQAA